MMQSIFECGLAIYHDRNGAIVIGKAMKPKKPTGKFRKTIQHIRAMKDVTL